MLTRSSIEVKTCEVVLKNLKLTSYYKQLTISQYSYLFNNVILLYKFKRKIVSASQKQHFAEKVTSLVIL